MSRPTIDRAVAAVRRTCGLQAAGISRLEPGAAIRPHTGPTNRRWTLHLGVVVDAADVDGWTPRRTVAGTARAGAWVQGKVVLFDDPTSEHDVVHAGARDRVVLDTSVDHPSFFPPGRWQLLRALARATVLCLCNLVLCNTIKCGGYLDL